MTKRRHVRGDNNGQARLILPALLLLSACGAEVDAEGGEPNADTETSVDAAPDPISEEIAELELTDGAKVVFLLEPSSGRVAIGEVGPANLPSQVEALVDGEQASPLEVFLALSPKGTSLPEALRIDYAMTRMGDPNQLDAPSPSPEASAPSSLREQAAVTAILEGANCSLAADGAWFDSAWTHLRAPWHHYSNLEDFAGLSFRTPLSPAVSNWRGHVCLAEGPSIHVYFKVNHVHFWNTETFVGQRARLWMEGWSPSNFQASYLGGLGLARTVRLGALAY